MKGITLILTEPLSEKAKEKLRKLSENQKKHLEQMKKDFEDGKYDDIISQLKKEKQLFLITFECISSSRTQDLIRSKNLNINNCNSLKRLTAIAYTLCQATYLL